MVPPGLSLTFDVQLFTPNRGKRGMRVGRVFLRLTGIYVVAEGTMIYLSRMMTLIISFVLLMCNTVAEYDKKVNLPQFVAFNSENYQTFENNWV